ncbi:hypothetical protein POM88_043635 [Heracleum sosnowskyi]|uniref:Zinc finger PHD-type domain-containing protein n=1 Tax=Heracleum sosnowskyi TaxID=360622 RepID=A0AAD8M391_9APIA|nr:hypothetical protein POM88_043635 [Heracleum sosnowskyi]
MLLGVVNMANILKRSVCMVQTPKEKDELVPLKNPPLHTGGLGLASADGGQFKMGYFFTQPKDDNTVIIHSSCVSWVLAHHKAKNLVEILKSSDPSPTCVICGKDKAFLGCSQCGTAYHLLCASRNECTLIEENFVLLCVKHPLRNPMIDHFDKESKKYSLELHSLTQEPTSVFPVPPPNLIAREKVLVLVWYYNKVNGFVLHGMWIGEIDAGKVILLNNDICEIKDEPLYKDILSMLDKLPSSTVDHMKTFWFSSEAGPESVTSYVTGRTYPTFWIYEILKHAVQDGLIMFPDYFERLVKLSQPFVGRDNPESLRTIMEDLNRGNSTGVHMCADLAETISNKFGKTADLKFKEGHMTVQLQLSFVFKENGEKVDHPSPHSVDQFSAFRF